MMGRWLLGAALAGLLAGCGTFTGTVATDPSRTLFGVEVSQPAPPPGDAAAQADAAKTLQWKVSQICTTGYGPVHEDVEPAESDHQIVDWQLRCSPYCFSLLGVNFAGLVPF
jgi:hypothetical protein